MRNIPKICLFNENNLKQKRDSAAVDNDTIKLKK